jgi:hypothetical protein
MSLRSRIETLIRDASGLVDLRLQLGCGANILPGWLNTDSMPVPDADYLDFARPLPFSDNVLTAVFCEHTIEHVTKPEAFRMVVEVCRVLRPGGLFRVVTPSLEKFCRMALEPSSPAAVKYLAWFKGAMNSPDATITDAVNLIFYGHGHRYIFSGDELNALLRAAGFTDLRQMDPNQYGHPIFNGVDGHGKVLGHEINTIESMAIEAAKPG